MCLFSLACRATAPVFRPGQPLWDIFCCIRRARRILTARGTPLTSRPSNKPTTDLRFLCNPVCYGRCLICNDFVAPSVPPAHFLAVTWTLRAWPIILCLGSISCGISGIGQVLRWGLSVCVYAHIQVTRSLSLTKVSCGCSPIRRSLLYRSSCPFCLRPTRRVKDLARGESSI